MCLLAICSPILLIVGVMMLFMGESSATFYILIGIICFLVVYFNISKMSKEYDEFKDFKENKYKEHGLNPENIKIDLEENSSKKLIYTYENKLFYGDLKLDRFEEIDIKNILKVEHGNLIDIKNIKNPISLTSTYQTKGTITAIDFKIITDCEIYSLILEPSAEVKDKATRLQLIIEKEMERIKEKS